MVLTEEKIAELKEEIKAANERQEEINIEHKEEDKRIRFLQGAIKKLEGTIEDNKKKIQEHQQQKRLLAEEHNPLYQVIEKAEKQIADHEWESKVRELVAQQPDFYAVLQRELERLHQEYSASLPDLVELVDPATACKNIRAAIDSQHYGYETLSLREGEIKYREIIRNLCESKVNGKSIPLNRGMLPSDYVRSYVMNDHVIKYWKKG